jgi:hypothetical protein
VQDAHHVLIGQVDALLYLRVAQALICITQAGAMLVQGNTGDATILSLSGSFTRSLVSA